MKKHDRLNPNDPQERLRRLGLHGLLTHWTEIANEPWLERLLAIEEQERMKRSLERRLRNAHIGAFKGMSDFDWNWPKSIDREAVEELFGFGFAAEGINAILLGPNGVGKTMILRNVANQATVFPHAACVVTLVDRLLHRAEVIAIEGDSYRLKEAKDRAATARARRPRKRDVSPPEHAHP